MGISLRKVVQNVIQQHEEDNVVSKRQRVDNSTSPTGSDTSREAVPTELILQISKYFKRSDLLNFQSAMYGAVVSPLAWP